jgi:hypothetical protein
MIADLIGTVNNLEQTRDAIITYRSVLFPAPAFKVNKLLVQGSRCGSENIRLP